MTRTIYLASSNPGKLRELAALAEGQGFRLEPLPDYQKLPQANESAQSFALNALEKALHYSRLIRGTEPPGSRLGESGPLVVAEDSGLVVDALGGAPGARSARYAGANATDADNNQTLLAALANVPEEKWTARYVCVLVLARRGQALALFSDACEGRILAAPRGSGGFGYDPLFLFPPLNRTMAELPVEEKNRYSHRGKAFAKLLAYLKERD